jgi:hypothetical protein
MGTNRCTLFDRAVGKAAQGDDSERSLRNAKQENAGCD